MGGACASKQAVAAAEPAAAAPKAEKGTRNGSNNNNSDNESTPPPPLKFNDESIPKIIIHPPVPTPEPSSANAITPQQSADVAIPREESKPAAPIPTGKFTEDAYFELPEGVAAEEVTKFHSAVRWGKPIADLEPFLVEDMGGKPDLLNAADQKNGNRAVHIAAQNGHEEITKWLIGTLSADANAQNRKGQTPLHMSIEYDFYFQNVFLLTSGADQTLTNADGHPAMLGIDGKKSGVEAWDHAMQKLKAVRDEASMEDAFAALEACTDELDKGMLGMTGMKKKKQYKEWWDVKRFTEIMSKF